MLGLATTTSQTTPSKINLVANSQSVYLDGGTDYLEFPDHNDFSPTDGSNNDEPFSVACWVKRTDTLAMGLFSKGDNGTKMEYKIFVVSNKIYFDLHDNASGNYKRTNSSNTYTWTNNWHHVVCTYNGNESHTGLKIYVNGAPVTRATGSGGTFLGIPNTNSKLTFGHQLVQGGYDMKGYVTDLMFWKNYELSASEAEELYQGGVYSVDPTKASTQYNGASSCVLWAKCDADYTITASSTSTSYAAVEDTGNPEENECVAGGGSVEDNSVCDANGVSIGAGYICCVTSTTTPAVTGIQDSSGTAGSKHGTYKNGANITTGSGNTPTATSL